MSSKNETKSISNILTRLITLLVFSFSLFTLIFLFSVNQKGFDIADEGFHLLASQFPNDVEIWPNVAHIYTGIMFNLVGKNIIGLRILSELLLFLSASVFFLGLLRLVSVIYPIVISNINFKIIAWSMMCLGALFYYINFDTTPSYNSLNASFLNMAAGFICFSLAYMSVNPKKPMFTIFNSFIAGIFTGVVLLIKFPTAIALTLLFSFIIIIWPQARKNERFLNISLLVLGEITGVLLHVIFLQPWLLLWHTIYYGIYVFLTLGLHEPGHSFQNYTLEIIRLIMSALKDFWKIYIVFFLGTVVSWYQFKKNNSTKILGIFFITLFFLAVWNSIAFNFHKGGFINSIFLMEIYVGWLLLLIFLVVFTLIYHKQINYNNNITVMRFLVLAVLLLALPFAGAIGTANIITLNITQYMASWFGMILVLLFVLTCSYNNRWIFLSGSLIISGFASSQIISAGFIAPYNLKTTIQYQTVQTAIGIPTTYLELDKASSEFFAQINLIAKSHGFKPGNDILAFSNMPGVVFALGGRSPVVPWYLTLPHSKEINEWLLKQASPVRIKNAFILQNASSDKGMPDLTKLGINFPSEYIFCGESIWPLTGEWVRLWKPKQLST